MDVFNWFIIEEWEIAPLWRYICNPNVKETKVDLQVVVRLKMRGQWSLQVTQDLKTSLS